MQELDSDTALQICRGFSVKHVQGFTLTEIWWSRSGDQLQKVSRPTEKLVARIV